MEKLYKVFLGGSSAQHEGSGTKPGLTVWSLCVFLMSAWVSSDFVLQSTDMQFRIIGDYKLPKGVGGCLSLSVSSVMNY